MGKTDTRNQYIISEITKILIIILTILIVGIWTWDIPKIIKKLEIIQSQQNQIILLLSKDYPDFEKIYKIKKPKLKMEKDKILHD